MTFRDRTTVASTGSLRSGAIAKRIQRDPKLGEKLTFSADEVEAIKERSHRRVDEAAAPIDPEHEGCRLFRSLALGKLGKVTEAEDEADTLLEQEPDDEMSHMARGYAKLHAASGDPQHLSQVDHLLELLREEQAQAETPA